MAEKLDPRQVATFEELLMTVLYEQEATRRVMVRKGLLTNDECLKGQPVGEKRNGSTILD